MGSAGSYTSSSSSDPAALIQRQDSNNSLASVASSAIDMASVERESPAESASKGASAPAILPLATLEELDLKPFFALAPSFSAVAGSDAPAAAVVLGGEIGTCASWIRQRSQHKDLIEWVARINPDHAIERGGSGPAGGAAASEGHITTMTQFLSHLKVTAIRQHPMRRHTYVLASTIGG